MKKFILVSFVILLGIIANAQVKEGNTFKQVKEKTEQVEEKTKFSYEDSKGQSYPIYQSKRGSFYVVKTSKKTGKEYRYYLPKEIQEEIKKHL
jgi:tRNA splicing endonuclease